MKPGTEELIGEIAMTMVDPKLVTAEEIKLLTASIANGLHENLPQGIGFVLVLKSISTSHGEVATNFEVSNAIIMVETALDTMKKGLET